ncbi:MAG: hypothetical protein KDJ65_28970 [Anaerolineae bacterium]|nr:hypothetical protein [Anaerolineae bacterium]
MYSVLKESAIPSKVRKQIYVEPYQDLLLKKVSKETGLSEAEFIRQAIDHHAQLFQQLPYNEAVWQTERAFITSLIDLGSVAGERNWRREDLYER